jgi:hypothetical protein
VGAGQAGVDPALVEEDQTAGVDLGQVGAPDRPGGDEIGAVLLRGAEGFLRTKPNCLSVRHKVGTLTRTPTRSAR